MSSWSCKFPKLTIFSAISTSWPSSNPRTRTIQIMWSYGTPSRYNVVHCRTKLILYLQNSGATAEWKYDIKQSIEKWHWKKIAKHGTKQANHMVTGLTITNSEWERLFINDRSDRRIGYGEIEKTQQKTWGLHLSEIAPRAGYWHLKQWVRVFCEKFIFLYKLQRPLFMSNEDGWLRN